MSMPENPAQPGPAQPGHVQPGHVQPGPAGSPARSTISPKRQRAVLLATLGLLLAIAGTYAAFDEWSTAAGVLCGGGLVLGLMWFAGRRASSRGVDAATAERVFSGRGDERDKRVYLTTMAVVGYVAFIAAALLPAAVNLGLDVDVALGSLPYLLITTGVVTFITTDRRT